MRASESDGLIRSRDTDWIGQTLDGKFLVLSRIGRGSSGSVYEAEQQPLGRRVAIKILGASGDGLEERSITERRFVREASLLAQLGHPNTVRVFDFGTSEGHPWLAMELCRGKPLSALFDQPMDPLRLVGIAIQICGSLREAHGLGLVHRDLKPGNILVETFETADRVKVVDFGLVKSSNDSENLTANGLLVGTPMFMSPEQVMGKLDIDPRSDLYALGILLYRGSTATYPFDQTSIATVLLGHVQAAPKPFPDGTPMPSSLQRLVLKLLNKDRERRPPSASTVAMQLGVVERVLKGEISDAMAVGVIEEGLRAPPPSRHSSTSTSHVSSMVEPVSFDAPTRGGQLASLALVALGFLLAAGAFVAVSGGTFMAEMFRIFAE